MFYRALIANPKILILDEATSSIDTYTEYYVQKALQKLLADRHRLLLHRDYQQCVKQTRC